MVRSAWFVFLVLAIGVGFNWTVLPAEAQTTTTNKSEKSEAATQSPLRPGKNSGERIASSAPLRQIWTQEKVAEKSSQTKPKTRVAKSGSAQSTREESTQVDESVEKTATSTPVETDESPKTSQSEIAVERKLTSEMLLPSTTKAWLSIPDADLLMSKIDSTQFGLLAKDPAIKPFVDSLRDQIKQALTDKNIQLGLGVDEMESIHSGEICIAGVLPNLEGVAKARNSHGIVLLVDVTKTERKARELLKSINEKRVSNGATLAKPSQINGVVVTKLTPKKSRLVRNPRSNFQAITNGWMVVSNNERIFRDVLRRLAAPKKIIPAETLAKYTPFVTVESETDLEEHTSHIRWFVDPFGYIELAQAIEDEERGKNRKDRDDWSKILRDAGFSAFKGLGGNVSVSTPEHELLHKTFLYAPQNVGPDKEKRVFKLFDFANNGDAMTPARWVPDNCSGYLLANWDLEKAFKGSEFIYDAFIGEEGAFQRLLMSLKTSPGNPVDLAKLVSLLGNRITVVSAVDTKGAISASSERIAIGIPVNGSPDFVFKSMKNLTVGEVFKLGGIEVIKSEERKSEDSTGGFDLDNLGDIDDPDFREVPDEEEKQRFELFKERYITVFRGYLLIANDKKFLRSLLARKRTKLPKTEQYIQVQEALKKLTDQSKVGWQQFGRTDLALQTNYEMMRQGKMGQSNTVLARVINKIFESQEQQDLNKKPSDEEKIRQQKLDGSKLPADYAKSVAPFLGATGTALEIESLGWKVTGVMLKKSNAQQEQESDDSQ